MIEKGPEGPEGKKKRDLPKAEKELTIDQVRNFSSLDLKVDTDLSEVLESLNKATGSDMKHRESGFHATIIGPAEREVLKGLDAQQLEALKKISEDIRTGEGIEVRGFGFIDGAEADVPEKDKTKKTSYVAVDAPALNEFRASLGLPEKDLHITLGIAGGDIHYEKTGEKDEKGKDVLRLIPKKADPELDYLETLVPEIRFSGLSGKEKQKKKEKPADPEKMKKKKLKTLLSDSGLVGKDLIELGFKPGPEMGKTIAAIESAVKDGGPLNVELSDEQRKALEDRMASARSRWEEEEN